MPGQISFKSDKDKSGTNVWKAVGLGLAVGTVAVVGTAAYVSNKLHTEDGLDGAALITATLAAIGGGSIESGGNGMVGGLVNLGILAAGGVAAGAATSYVYDQINFDTSMEDFI